MYLFLFLFLSVFCFVTGSSNYPVRKVIRTDSGSTKTYIIDDGGYSFYDGKEWCDKLKGSLPVIKTRADFDFLTDKVVVKHSPGFNHDTWLGMKAIGFFNKCKSWLDDSNIDFTLFSKFDSRCGYCEQFSCCAMFVHGKPGNVYKAIGFSSCQDLKRRVCIIEGEAELPENKDTSTFIQSPQTGIILSVIFSSLISCFITSFILIYITREVSLKMRGRSESGTEMSRIPRVHSQQEQGEGENETDNATESA